MKKCCVIILINQLYSLFVKYIYILSKRDYHLQAQFIINTSGSNLISASNLPDMASQINRLRRLDPKKTLFLLCDIQEKFRPTMKLFDGMVKNVNKLVQSGKELEVPLICTEHYPEKLGKTVPDIDIKHACAIVKKTRFSMMVPELEKKMKEIFNDQPRDVVLFGLEAHVCVEQTAMDLIDKNINVMLVADCCCSRLTQDRDLALERLRQIGCIITTSESIIFNIMEDKNHPAFNTVRKYLNEPSADMHLGRPLPKL